ncbi:MAG: helix-turn-helix transcriptional regulator [Deltaproteobacteria bacterium]|nr:helix-turn-helix transcriptional regulator [Deltaproteobacteria bacterium]
MSPPDAVSVLEACYAVDLAEDARWLQGVVTALRGTIAGAGGIVSYLYASPRGEQLLPSTFVFDGNVGPANETMMRGLLTSLPAALLKKVLDVPFLRGRDVEFPGHNVVWAGLRLAGIADNLVFNGRDPSGYGCFAGVAVAHRPKVTKRQAQMFAQLAAHMASGYRLRRRLRTADNATDNATEAIVTPQGLVTHAESPAQAKTARQALAHAAKSLERARGKLRRDDPERAVDEWRGLIAARWTLIEQFESDGKRFLVAKRNDPPIASIESLTPRELQAVGFASLGHANKLIAYEMGISASTVGVLLGRAAKRIGVRTRHELIQAYLRVQK